MGLDLPMVRTEESRTGEITSGQTEDDPEENLYS